jgi:predicted DNA-binding protein
VKTLLAPDRRKTGVNISLDLPTLAKLDESARRTGMSRSALVRYMIEDWSKEDEEDAALQLEAERRLADPDDETIPWEQAKAELGL